MPEFNSRPIKAAEDIFSLRLVIFYYISGGQHPYAGNDDYEHERNILTDNNKNIFLPEETSKEVSDLMTPEARNLIEVMLCRDPRKMFTFTVCLVYNFFLGNFGFLISVCFIFAGQLQKLF